MASLIINDLPFPFNANLESIFINDIIPYFQKTLNKHGKIYLIGHSLGGYNALSLGLRHPSVFRVVIAISPFISTKSPFDDKFVNNKSVTKKNIVFTKFIKKALIYTFKDEKKWDEYNAFDIVNNSNNKNYPFIIISSSQEELPEFTYSIKNFLKSLDDKKIEYKYFITPGNHQKPKIEKLFVFFIKKQV